MYHPRFKGRHYDIGLKYGQMLKKQKIDFDQLIRLDDFQREHGRQSHRILAEIFPQVCEEIRGVCEGLEYCYEKFATWLLCMGCCYVPRGCTTFCFSYNGQVIIGRNNDLPPFLKKNSMSALYKLDNGNAFIGNTSSMINFEEGLNKHGLAVAMEFIMPTRIMPGFNSVFLVRYLLEKCATTGESVAALRGIPIASACSIILADKSGEMAVIECETDEQVVRQTTSEDNFLIAANHFISEEMRVLNSNSIYSSEIRYRTAYDALTNIEDENPAEYTQAILSGKRGFMCQYDPSLHFETIWSSIFDVTGMRTFRAEGDPARVKYKEDTRTKHLLNM